MSGKGTDSDLAMLRADFPGHLIGQESIMGRVRYVARRRWQGTQPHTVITPDLGELRAALETGRAAVAERADG